MIQSTISTLPSGSVQRTLCDRARSPFGYWWNKRPTGYSSPTIGKDSSTSTPQVPRCWVTRARRSSNCPFPTFQFAKTEHVQIREESGSPPQRPCVANGTFGVKTILPSREKSQRGACPTDGSKAFSATSPSANGLKRPFERAKNVSVWRAAAARLGLKRTTLQSMIKRLGIQPDEYRGRASDTFGA